MKIEDFLKKLSVALRDKTTLPFYLIGQNQDTSTFEEYGTFQLLDVSYNLTNRKSYENGDIDKFWTIVIQINVNVKNKEGKRFRDIEIITTIVDFLSKEYYFVDEIEPRKHFPTNLTSVRDLTKAEMQSTIYTKSIDITFEGIETFNVERVPIDKVSGTVTEEVSGLTDTVEVIKN